MQRLWPHSSLHSIVSRRCVGLFGTKPTMPMIFLRNRAGRGTG
jgi:hypothetical protein